MALQKSVPRIVVSRLPVYLRALQHMAQEGKVVTSSQALAQRLGTTSAQIRKDLSYFGEFGRQGMGYEVQYLMQQLRRILHVDREWPVALVGVGDLGRALAHYAGFPPEGFRIVAAFDNDPRKIGQSLAGLTIQDSAHLREVIARERLKVAIVAVPASGAQSVADELVAGGIRAILNYAPITLNVPEGVQVQYVDPVVHLQRMTFYLDEEEQG